MRAGIFFLSGLIYFFSFEDGIGLPAMFCMFGVVGINILLGTQSIRFPWLPLQPPATNVIMTTTGPSSIIISTAMRHQPYPIDATPSFTQIRSSHATK